MKKQFEEWLLAGGEVCVSLINEPLEYEIAPLTARQIADRRWGSVRVIDGEKGR